MNLGTYVLCGVCLCVRTTQLSEETAGQKKTSFTAQYPFTHTCTHKQAANRRSEKGHLCLPGLPGDKEEAVIRSIDPVWASLANHHSTSGVSTAAVAAVMLQKVKLNIIL